MGVVRDYFSGIFGSRLVLVTPSELIRIKTYVLRYFDLDPTYSPGNLNMCIVFVDRDPISWATGRIF